MTTGSSRSISRAARSRPSPANTGNGAATTSGDNGPATAAVLNVPTGLAMDSARETYVADSGDQRIRANPTVTLDQCPPPSSRFPRPAR